MMTAAFSVLFNYLFSAVSFKYFFICYFFHHFLRVQIKFINLKSIIFVCFVVLSLLNYVYFVSVKHVIFFILNP